MSLMQSVAVAENKIFHALADPSRRAILESLTRGEAAVNAGLDEGVGDRGAAAALLVAVSSDESARS